MESQQLRAALAAAQAGEAEGYEALLAAYGPRLYGYFLRATGDAHDSEDLLGELTLRLLKRLKDYDDRGRFEPWLFRIAANLVRDRFRRQKSRGPRVSLWAGRSEGAPLAEQLPAQVPAVDADLIATEASDQLDEAMAGLDETTRQTLLLRYFGQMSYKEIADVLSCPIGTVLARAHRGLRTLRRLMGSEDGVE